jgi:hypothetical protein
MYQVIITTGDSSDEQQLSVQPPETSLALSGLSPATNYTITVAHINEAGAASANISVRTDDPPAQAIPPPEPDVEKSRAATSTGELAGLAVGGTLLLLVLLVIFFAFRHRYSDTRDLKAAPAVPSEIHKDTRPFWQQEHDQIELRPAVTIAPTTNPGRLFAMAEPMTFRDDVSHKSFDLLNPLFLLDPTPSSQPHTGGAAHGHWNEDPDMALTTLLTRQTQALRPSHDPETAEFAYYNLLQASDTDSPLAQETRFGSTVQGNRDAVFAPVDPRFKSSYAAFEEDSLL